MFSKTMAIGTVGTYTKAFITHLVDHFTHLTAFIGKTCRKTCVVYTVVTNVYCVCMSVCPDVTAVGI